jgi:divalent metal cation (Fe/Co/Zn/Cd) transporter
MLKGLSSAERTLLFASLADFCMAAPLLTTGFLSGSASASSEAVRGILLWSIDLFSLSMLLLVNRHRFSQFEFGIEKIQIAVQVVIALGMCVSIAFISARIWHGLAEGAHPPNYLVTVMFTVVSYVNVVVNVVALRKMVASDRLKPSLILRGQIKNRTVMLVSSVVATLSAATVILPDPVIFAYIDSIGAIVVLAVIVYTMVQMLRFSILTLLDAPIEEKEKLYVFREIAERFDLWSSIAFVRTRRLGYSKYIEVGLTFDDSLPMQEALGHCRAIEEGIHRSVDHAFVRVFPVGETAPA